MHNGVLINLLKNPLCNKSYSNALDNLGVIWMYYDWIQVCPVQSFSDYFLSHCSESKAIDKYIDARSTWTGEIQTLHLFSLALDDNEAQHFVFEAPITQVGSPLFVYRSESPKSYYCLIALRIHPQVQEEYNEQDGYLHLLKEVATIIQKKLNNLNSTFEIFGSWGTEDLVVIVTDDSMKRLLLIVEMLRSTIWGTPPSQKHLFCHTHSFIGQNMSATSIEPDTSFMTSFTLKPSISDPEFLLAMREELQKLELNNCITAEMIHLGEYDVRLIMKATPGVKFGQLFAPGGCMHTTSPFYQRYVLQSKTIWFWEETEEISSIQSLGPSEETSVEDTKNEVFDPIVFINETVKKSFLGHLYIIEMLSLLASEFNRHLLSSEYESWHSILRRIANSYSHCLQEMVSPLESKLNFLGNNNDKTELLIEMTHSIRQIFNHIDRAGHRSLQAPASDVMYYGSYGHIYRAYYGYINWLLKIGTLIPRDEVNAQAKLTYILNFGFSSQIVSYSYRYSNDPKSEMLVTFKIPYDALYDFSRNLPYLTHEVFHYIAPINRHERNRILFTLNLSMFFHTVLMEYCKYVFSLKSSKERNRLDGIRDELINAVVMHLDKKAHVYSAELWANPLNTVEAFNVSAEDIGSLPFDQLGVFILKTLFADGRQNSDCVGIIKFLLGNLLTKSRDNGLFENFNGGGRGNSELIKGYKHINPKEIWAFFNELLKCLKSDKFQIFSQEFSQSSKFVLLKTQQEAIILGINEAMCDRQMIQLLALSLEEYLDIFLEQLDSINMDLNDYQEQESGITTLTIRLGMLFDAFCADSAPLSAQPTKRECHNWVKEKLTSYFKDKRPKKIMRFLLRRFDIYQKMAGRHRDTYSELQNMVGIDSILESFNKIIDGSKHSFKWNQMRQRIAGIYLALKKANTPDERFIAIQNMILFFQYQEQYDAPLYSFVPYEQNAPSSVVHDPVDVEKVADDSTELAGRKLQKKCNLRSIEYPLDRVSSLGKYFEKIVSACEKLGIEQQTDTESADHDVWFRGVCNSSYAQLPSLFRHLPKGVSPYGYLVILLQQLYADTNKFPALFSREMPTICEQISFMQHYSMHTNLLDFSTDAIVALYFALNPDADQDKESLEDAAVYVFSPTRYQEAVFHLQGRTATECRQLSTRQSITSCFDPPQNIFPGKISPEDIFSKKSVWDDQIKSWSESTIEAHYPIPITLPNTNQRISQQSGTFLAFDLCSVPQRIIEGSDGNEKLDFSTYDPRYIQDIYLGRYPGAIPFMQRITIDGFSKESLRYELLQIGIKQTKYYPEIERIAKHALAQVKAQYNR